MQAQTSMALSFSFNPVLKLHRQLSAVVTCAKKDGRSSDRFSWKKKRPRKRFSPRRDDLGDISVLYSKNVVVESSDQLLKNCTRYISDYIEDGYLSKAEKVFYLMIEKGLQPNAYTYTALMKGYSLAGNIERVSGLFKEMEEKGIEPTAVTFSTALQSYTITGDLEGALCLFNQMKNKGRPKPNAFIYSSLLNVCVTAKDIKAARRLFEEMRSSNVEPDRVTMNTMIDVYSECSNKKNGKKFLEQCRKLMNEMMEGKGITANNQTYSILLKLCVRGGLTDEAMDILTEMRDNHIRPDVVSYNTTLDGISKDRSLSRKEVLELSLKIVHDMEKEGVYHDAFSFTSLMNVALRINDLHRAVQLFKEMKRLKIEPTLVTYGTMIKCYEKLGDPSQGDAYLKPCLDLSEECEMAGLKLDVEGYISLLSACGKASNLDQALTIWNRMKERKVKPEVSVFNAMINACLSKDKESKAFDFLNQMKASGIKPTVVTYGTFLSYYVKTKDRVGAEKICDVMKTLEIEPNKVILRMMKGLGIE